jgi:hypothetical protein
VSVEAAQTKSLQAAEEAKKEALRKEAEEKKAAAEAEKKAEEEAKKKQDTPRQKHKLARMSHHGRVAFKGKRRPESLKTETDREADVAGSRVKRRRSKEERNRAAKIPPDSPDSDSKDENDNDSVDGNTPSGKSRMLSRKSRTRSPKSPRRSSSSKSSDRRSGSDWDSAVPSSDEEDTVVDGQKVDDSTRSGFTTQEGSHPLSIPHKVKLDSKGIKRKDWLYRLLSEGYSSGYSSEEVEDALYQDPEDLFKHPPGDRTGSVDVPIEERPVVVAVK